ncbi:MAG: CPBP family glutamic-type intramembrane protease [Chloroflexota bacterium]|nr:CPBP family glutamic-type intramembrane protease [Chloroflexota bacterium]
MSSLLSVVRRHPVVTFFFLTYAIGWGCIPFWTFQAGSPFIAALVVIPLTQGVAGLKELGLRIIRWRVRWHWYALAIGVPLAVVGLVAGLNVALGAGAPSLASYGSFTTILMVFAVRLVNPGDGALGEEPGWRGFALPGLQSTHSPLASTLILGVLVTGWHVPLLFLEEGASQPSIIVGFLLGSFTVTFWYTWLFNHTGGSVLLSIVSHAVQGTITIGGLWTMGAAFAQANLITGFVWLAVAVGLIVFDRKAWRGPAAAGTTTPQVTPPREAAPAAP